MGISNNSNYIAMHYKAFVFLLALVLGIGSTATAQTFTAKDSAYATQHNLTLVGKAGAALITRDTNGIAFLVRGLEIVDTIRLVEGWTVAFIPEPKAGDYNAPPAFAAKGGQPDTIAPVPTAKIPVTVSAGSLWGAGSFLTGEARFGKKWSAGIYAQPNIGLTPAVGYRVIEGGLPLDLRFGYSITNKFPVIAASTSKSLYGGYMDLRGDLSFSMTQKIGGKRHFVTGLLAQAPIRLWRKFDLGPSFYMGWADGLKLGGGVVARYRFELATPKLPAGMSLPKVNLPSLLPALKRDTAAAKTLGAAPVPPVAKANREVAKAMPGLTSFSVYDDSTKVFIPMEVLSVTRTSGKGNRLPQSWHITTKEKGSFYLTLTKEDAVLRQDPAEYHIRFAGVPATQAYGRMTSSPNGWQEIILNFR